MLNTGKFIIGTLLTSMSLSTWAVTQPPKTITCETVSACPDCRNKNGKVDPALNKRCHRFKCICELKKDNNNPRSSTNAYPNVTVPTMQ